MTVGTGSFPGKRNIYRDLRNSCLRDTPESQQMVTRTMPLFVTIITTSCANRLSIAAEKVLSYQTVPEKERRKLKRRSTVPNLTLKSRGTFDRIYCLDDSLAESATTTAFSKMAADYAYKPDGEQA